MMKNISKFIILCSVVTFGVVLSPANVVIAQGGAGNAGSNGMSGSDPVVNVGPGGDGGGGVFTTPQPPSCTVSEATIQGILACVRQTIVIPLINIVMGLAVLAFFWGLVKYLYKADNEAERKKGKNLMFFGIIALFVMVSVWGIVTILQNSLFGEAGPMTPPIPQLPAGLL